MTRIEHFNDPEAPPANRLVPAASAVVADDQGRIRLQRRSDNALWSIPGGAMEPGESIAQTVVRGVKEETGLDVEPEALVGIYSNPHHVIEYADGEVRQQFSVCFACRIVGGELAVSEESTEVGFFAPAEIEAMPMHESIRLRIRHYLEHRPQPVVA
jgi:ADP-ribose pyrophosphatase YjhB (NUDIX family)